MTLGSTYRRIPLTTLPALHNQALATDRPTDTVWTQPTQAASSDIYTELALLQRIAERDAHTAGKIIRFPVNNVVVFI